MTINLYKEEARKEKKQNNNFALISGSFGKQNLGDDALLNAFLLRNKSKYQKVFAILEENFVEGIESEGVDFLEMPKLAIGRDFLKGTFDRSRKRQQILNKNSGMRGDYYLTGGVLGFPIHVKIRYKELLWAKTVCSKFIYYFGDAEYKPYNLKTAQQWVNTMNDSDSWISVRSIEAASLLTQTGYSRNIHVGLDPVLFERVSYSQKPFQRHKACEEVLALIPCVANIENMRDTWIKIAVSGIRRGLKLRWISFCDPYDLEICRSLFQEISHEYPNHPQEICYGQNIDDFLKDPVCCVAARLHGAIYSITNGIPTVAVCYAKKIERLFNMLNLENWILIHSSCHSPASSSIDKFSSMLDEAMSNGWCINSKKFDDRLENHKKALQNLNAFIK
ncbi:polysaccharide pyruvyl transferase family protein [Leptothoe sp. LEGE 181152]|nr:polysaccharide pyruvyl transferase family protein [Leptothoe sp. LEGE 181152]